MEKVTQLTHGISTGRCQDALSKEPEQRDWQQYHAPTHRAPIQDTADTPLRQPCKEPFH